MVYLPSALQNVVCYLAGLSVGLELTAVDPGLVILGKLWRGVTVCRCTLLSWMVSNQVIIECYFQVLNAVVSCNV